MNKPTSFREDQTRPIYCPECGSEDAELRLINNQLGADAFRLSVKLECFTCGVYKGAVLGDATRVGMRSGQDGSR